MQTALLKEHPTRSSRSSELMSRCGHDMCSALKWLPARCWMRSRTAPGVQTRADDELLAANGALRARAASVSGGVQPRGGDEMLARQLAREHVSEARSTRDRAVYPAAGQNFLSRTTVMCLNSSPCT